MSFFRFLLSKTFWINILIMVVVLVAVGWGGYKWLKSFTLQGVSIEIPDLTTFTIEEAERTLAKYDLTLEVLDSNEFFPEYPRSSVIDQYPSVGSKVKPNRRITVTLNASGPKKIPVPEVLEKTRRRAIYDLESKGFVVGELMYVPYIGKDVVIGLRHKGAEIVFPANLTKGSKIDLVVGMGLSSQRVRVPYIKNLSIEEAREKLNTFSLNLGAVVYDDELKDTLSAFIYQQDPVPNWDRVLRMGNNVDVWVTNDENKRALDSLSFYEQNPGGDTLNPDDPSLIQDGN
ncbi:MAG: PASTA domain-containing protein [Cryomorphaceae bacterium]|nr:PASTA domain-containing protein [Cryomorphaceae bacterium]